MTKKAPHKLLKDAVIDAALQLASEESWQGVEFDRILMAANVDKDEALEYFDDKEDVLLAYGRRVDARVKENVSFGEGEISVRDKIFDILMERFDILNEDRAAILSILNSFKADPKQIIISLPHLGRSMGRVFDLAGVENEGMSGAVKVTGLIGVYLYTVKTWKEDDSADMAKTMAALDKALDMSESAANSCENGGFLSVLSGFTERYNPKSTKNSRN